MKKKLTTRGRGIEITAEARSKTKVCLKVNWVPDPTIKFEDAGHVSETDGELGRGATGGPHEGEFVSHKN